ncbi:unnamed protein product [Clonostachys chloroleuca]|uniref:Uncharacterized protein n=1 Tax=Clonostachys chloroleuca TaxID=1926264 RepID=A0AA35QF71_9HYPO|nr:unnamed protein product [Clonostachys chloroleuca]
MYLNDRNIEGLEVLYGTNTIHIDTRILLLGLHEILSPEKLCLMKDLEINVSRIIDVASYFKGLSNETPPENVSVLFPSLRRLRLTVPGMDYFSQEQVDKLAQRILLPSTEVIVSHDPGLQWHDEGNIEFRPDGPKITGVVSEDEAHKGRLRRRLTGVLYDSADRGKNFETSTLEWFLYQEPDG